MLDYRIYTFLELCKVMNYRKTAEILNMTQPAVTQHIKFLEAKYGCKLFEYEGKVLSKTDRGSMLEEYARGLVYTDRAIHNQMSEEPVHRVAIGVTKTIGEYTIEDRVLELVKRPDIELHLIVDNTKHLLQQLNNLELDFLMLEGYFDKNVYGYQPIKTEEIIGICAKEHSFAGREIALEETFGESLIVREEGSGTRAVFERFLTSRNYSVDSYEKKTILSSYKLIEKVIQENLGISFVYQSVLDQERFSTFRIKDVTMMHEFNYVFLKNTKAEQFLSCIGRDILL